MQLDTERLIMRDYREDDWPIVAAYWADPRYQRFYPVNERQEETVRKLVASFVAAQAEQPRQRWQLALVTRADGRLIGNCGIRVNDPELREANIGYELNPTAGARAMPVKRRAPFCASGLRSLGCTASGPSASRTTSAQRACWRSSACGARRTSASCSGFAGAGGMATSTPCSTASGGDPHRPYRWRLARPRSIYHRAQPPRDAMLLWLYVYDTWARHPLFGRFAA